MNVLMLGWEFPPHISGGLGVACQGLTWGLKQLKSTQVKFVLPTVSGREQPGLADFIPLFDVVQPADTAAPLSAAYCGGLTDVLRYADQMDKVLARTGAPDVIHAHDWLTFPAGIKLKEKSGRPLVVHVHSTEIDRAGNQPSKDIVGIEKLGMQQADVVIAVSEFTRQVIIERYGIDSSKVIVIHNASNDGPATTAPGRVAVSEQKTVSFIGRMTYQKGPKYFVEAARLILKQNTNVRFVMAGTGDLLHIAKALTQAFGIAEYFEFPGFLDKDGVEKLLAKSDVYIMPSVAEPFGIGALEAILADVPVVLSRQSGVGEVVDSVAKVDYWDVAAIAAATLALLADPQLARRNAARAKQEAQALCWSKSAAKVVDIYRSF